jgi:SAM-dependent methyltransferase
MTFSIIDIIHAHKELKKFRVSNNNKNHERFIFPFLCGSYFTYRKVDVVRIFTISKAISENPTYLDVGCGYGDFLEKIREYIPTAEGIEKSAEIFYSIGRIKPEYIKIADAYNGIDKKYDIIFVGWMEPGVDYRDKIAESSPQCIITTLDQGGQCGINGGCEFDGHGFEKIASWITPSWIDVNTELMNKYYTNNIKSKEIWELKNLRGAHNLWYIYCKPQLKNILKVTLEKLRNKNIKEKYKHEEILDECGFGFKESIPLNSGLYLWDIKIEK